ncbi:transposase family protein [Kitasatospora sp. NPDC056531]|uniref:helix-turn-helix domain-containing protein n=1 Tax=Kitasatospora sp. NPDC056531 TaxID=3345856 RepID=UPI0036C4147F
MLAELSPRWWARRESELDRQRGGERRRAEGAGRKPKLEFVDRLLVTLVHLRLGLPHAALAELYRVDRSTVSAAIRQVRPVLATRGFAVPDRPGIRLRTLEDVFAYADTDGVNLRIDGTEVQVRRPRAGRPGRKAFVSGKKKQNTIGLDSP